MQCTYLKHYHPPAIHRSAWDDGLNLVDHILNDGTYWGVGDLEFFQRSDLHKSFLNHELRNQKYSSTTNLTNASYWSRLKIKVWISRSSFSAAQSGILEANVMIYSRHCRPERRKGSDTEKSCFRGKYSEYLSEPNDRPWRRRFSRDFHLDITAEGYFRRQ